MIRYLLLIIIIISLNSFSQNYDKKKFKNTFQDAEYFFLFEDYKSALPLFLELYKMDSTNANVNYKVGVCYSEDKLRSHYAIKYLEKAIENISEKYRESSYKEKDAPPDAYKFLGKAYQRDFEFDKAIEAYQKYETYLKVDDIFEIEKTKQNIQACDNAKELLVQSALNFVKVDILPETVNSPYPDYTPVISGDGKRLIFTSRRRYRLNKNGEVKLKDMDVPDEFYMEDIYMSEFVGGHWTKAKRISLQLKADVYSSVVSISYDGKKLFILRKDILTGNEDEGNIYMSKWDDQYKRWRPMKKLNKNINTTKWETHASLSKDGTKLYFTSDRDGGFGGLDIYVSTIDENGDWGPAVNLGHEINTSLDEEYPFILSDGKTLYFTSQGHYNIGGHDIFYSTMTENGEWSSPINLGYPINTMDDDVFYCPMNNGKTAFMPLETIAGYGDLDIYRLDISESKYGDFGSQEFLSQKTDSAFFPTNLADLYKVNQKIDSSSIKTQIKYTEIKQEDTIPIITTIKSKELNIKGQIILSDNNVVDSTFNMTVIDPNTLSTKILKPEVETGKYKFTTKLNEFIIKISGNGYEPVTKNVVIPGDYTANEMVVDIYMKAQQVASGEYYTIKSIFFDYGKYELRRESKIELEKLYNLMIKNPTLYIEVIGHTDSKSSSEFNMKLSKARAKAAVDYLVAKGISVERFVAKGMGEENPIAINTNPDGSDNPDGRQFNRRVDIKILNTNVDNVVIEDVFVPENLRYSPRNKKAKNTYTILVFKQKQKYNNESVLNLKEDKTPNGYIYTVGNFEDKALAVKLLNTAVDLGFNDAKIIETKELNKLIIGESGQKNINTPEKQKDNQIVTNNTQRVPVYSIQLKALARPVDMNVFKGLKGVKEYLGPDGFYRYTYMEFTSRKEANKVLDKLQTKGFTDAFIININRYKMRDKTGNADYTIQLKAMKTPLNMEYFNNISRVKEYLSNNGLYIYTYGRYKKLEDAKKDLTKIRKKGYTDAFIVNFDKFK